MGTKCSCEVWPDDETARSRGNSRAKADAHSQIMFTWSSVKTTDSHQISRHRASDPLPPGRGRGQGAPAASRPVISASFSLVQALSGYFRLFQAPSEHFLFPTTCFVSFCAKFHSSPFSLHFPPCPASSGLVRLGPASGRKKLKVCARPRSSPSTMAKPESGPHLGAANPGRLFENIN